jgi:transposase, IS5 family
MRNKQISLVEAMAGFSRRKKVCRAVGMLAKISDLVNWGELATVVSVLDKTRTGKGGRPPIDFEVKLKMLFLQYTFNLSDEELEDQLIDRLSFQQFVGLSYDEEIPDFTTIWHFKEGLVGLGLMDKIFDLINAELEKHGLILKKGTMVDAMIIESATRPLSKKKREELAEKPSKQIDTDAKSTIKNGRKYFGYKGHVGVDVESKIIRKRTFTAANVHDSQELENVVSGDEKSIWADKAYPNKEGKQKARAKGIYYGILDRATRSKKLTTKQQKRNRQKSKVRASVEHVFGYMKKKLKVTEVGAKTKLRNALRFDMWCIIYNINRASFLLKKQKPVWNCA